MQKLLFFLFVVCTANVFSQKRVYMVGNIADFDTKKAINNARVLNVNAKAGTNTNGAGRFFVWASPGDSIKITAKGYHMRTIFCTGISKDSTYFLMSDPTYVTELDEVIVEGKRTDQMKRELKDLMGESLENGKFDAGSLIGANSNPNGMGAGLSINAIYDYFSKQGKDHRKADMLRQQSRFKHYAEWRLNRKLVTKLTGAQGAELEDFMQYLDLDQSYILRASDYELNATILSYYDAFKRRKKANSR